MNKKVSFDFDSTLSTIEVQKFAQELISKDIDVHIVTSRFEKHKYNVNHNDDVFEIADLIGIPICNIHFMNMVDKFEFFKRNDGFIFHLDDDFIEIELIQEHCSDVHGICLDLQPNWKELCNNFVICQ